MSSTPPKKYYKVAVLLFEGVDILDFTAPMEVFTHTSHNRNPDSPDRVFQINTIARSRTVNAKKALTVQTDLLLEDAMQGLADFDIMVVPGGPPSLLNALVASNPPEVELIRSFATLPPKTPDEPRVLFSICTGAFLVGAAGLLTGVSVTTHHRAIEKLREFCIRVNGEGASPPEVSHKRYIDAGVLKVGSARLLTAAGNAAISYSGEPQEHNLLGSYETKAPNVETSEIAASSSSSEAPEDLAEEHRRNEASLQQPLSEVDRHEQPAASDNTQSGLDIPPVTVSTPQSSDNPLVESKEAVPVTFKDEGKGTKDDPSHLLAEALETTNGEENSPISEDEATAIAVLKVIERYGVNFEKTGESWQGLTSFIPTVVEQVKKREAVRMILPAFPFKSPNARDKVLGVMPDLGEELALYHLNGLCENIGRVYEPDILGVPDETVWEYGEALRRMAVEKELHHVKFIRLFELLEHPWIPLTSAEQAKSYYLAHAQCLRRELMYRFEDRSFDADAAIRSDNDTCLTYRGYIKFLTKDLAPQMDTQYTSKKARAAHIAQIARSMIVRGKMFAAAIKANRADYVRLSIHESNGARKLSISLVPQVRGVLGYTPWHSSIAVDADGTLRAVHAEDVRETHELVYKNGQPYYFREKSKLFDWVEDGLRVKFEPLYPCGLIIRPSDIDDSRPPPSISHLPMHKVRQLSTGLSPVVLRGFRETLKEELYVQKASELGTILPWSFGIIQKVRDAGRTDKLGNNVTSNEAMPMHYDGMFKFEEETDSVTGEVKRVQKPPGYQFFTCPATAPKGSGYTLFASSRLFFRYLPLPWTTERLQKVTWGMDNDGFWDAKLKNLPLVVPHPVTGLPCMRWHQPWDSTKTKFSTCAVTIENDEQELASVVDDLTYDYRVCLRFSWEQGDLLVSDNTAMLHTRTGYKTNCERELWRIHFD
ncbi:hypothetical protein LV155_005513 [Aspergillus fumigatus]|nr:hypothetical protein CNMCM8714_000976 [Aspergillus fumigatus]KAJ8157282.1 hypothetical protein LV155_005513 [Aspergillus fumigatus]KAJ8198917.1 hypothetical protein LV161_000568 [Aspergillus fumigatus]KAJ8216425.1 hypothetical protein LV159_006391 [Aspergillus fumigatus]KAJ8217477.1 hypothetical protein LV158_002578 [Aspergillus fumigatus]